MVEIRRDLQQCQPSQRCVTDKLIQHVACGGHGRMSGALAPTLTHGGCSLGPTSVLPSASAIR